MAITATYHYENSSKVIVNAYHRLTVHTLNPDPEFVGNFRLLVYVDKATRDADPDDFKVSHYFLVTNHHTNPDGSERNLFSEFLLDSVLTSSSLSPRGSVYNMIKTVDFSNSATHICSVLTNLRVNGVDS